MGNSVFAYILLYIFIIILYYILLYIIIYLYLYIIIFIYIIIIYIVMCPKNGTIFMLRVPWMGLFIFCLVYVYIGNDIDLVESTPGVVFGGDFIASYFYILKSMDFIWVLVGYFCVWNFSMMKSVSGLFVDFGLGWEDSTI